MIPFEQEVGLWLGRYPGCFEQPTARQCWRAAYEAFVGGSHMNEILEFQMAVKFHGVHVWTSATGGYVLSWIDR